MKKIAILLASGLVAAVVSWRYYTAPLPANWSPQEVTLIQSLSLGALPPLPADPSNSVADSDAAATLGQQLYFDSRLSGAGNVSCASCHRPELFFTDGLPLAVAAGVGTRHSPSLVGLSYSPWFYWDGRKDSQWSQALAPLESGIEHNSDRKNIARLLMEDPVYRQQYIELFGEPPAIPDWTSLRGEDIEAIDHMFANAGKALAAYQRKLQPGRSRFDDYADSLAGSSEIKADDVLSEDELKGLGLFIGKAQCVNCHNGPLLTNHEFHNTGILAAGNQLPSMGRYDGIRLARSDPFNCLGKFSDATAA
ncbi:MAG: cytochrome-c peroxidase, partial [Gammaproteobacteria bacterium]